MLSSVTPVGRVSLGRFRGTPQTISLMKSYALGSEGEKNFMVRQWAESIVRQIAPKDYLSEIVALYGWARGPALRYTNDAAHVEQVKSPRRILTEIQKTGKSLVDCDDIATLLAAMSLTLGRRSQFVVASFSSLGDFTHVFCRIQEPKSKRWIVVDPVAGSRDHEMLQRIVNHQVIDVD